MAPSEIPGRKTESMSASSDSVTRLLADVRLGRRDALDRLLPIVHDELHRIATLYMRRERADHTLQPTALVNEAYLRLVDQRDVEWRDRAHFLGVAAQLMRMILVDHARARRAAKRAGGAERVPLEETILVEAERDVDLVALDEALERLAAIDPRLSRVVELRYFGGLTTRETAEVLGVSTATIEREWAAARGWLRRELTRGGPR
jgi:RNA polymerase sigma factor (TIGR02999 family)